MSHQLCPLKRVICLLLLGFLAGCGSGKPAPDATDSSESGIAEGDAKGKRIIPVRRDVKELDGNWVMVVTMQGQDKRMHDKYSWLIRLNKAADGKLNGEIVDVSEDDSEPKITSTELDGKSLHLKISHKGGTSDYEGDFDGIAIRGTLAFGPQVAFIARMLPTDADGLSKYTSQALPPATDVFSSAIQAMQKSQPQPKVIMQLAREHKTSPIAMEAVFGLLTLNAKAGFDDDTVRTIIEQYIELAKIWGKRMHANAEMLVVQNLVTSGRLPEEALKHLDQLEKLLGDKSDMAKSQIQMFRDQARIQLSLTKSHSLSDADRAAAHAELIEAVKLQPYNAEILLALGQYSAENKQLDEAIDYFTSIVALPILEQIILARRAGQPAGDPLPSDELKKLWTQKHQNTDGLEAFIRKRYDESLAKLRTELREKAPAVPPEDSGDHTVLVEFFTAGQMPPCIATEVAMDAVRESYPLSRVVTLRYHQHIPAADGLVNQDSEDRMNYYTSGKPLPLVVLDGAMMDSEAVPFGGFIQSSGTAFTILRSVIDPRLKQSTPIRIELAAKVEDGDLSVNANVTGIDEEVLPTLRLRLALAEETVDAPTPIGIRSHAMVVREMVGGSRGIAPKKGELKFSLSMPATDLQQHLDDYMTRYESGKKFTIPPEVKPPVKNPLYLVAWVQDDKPDTNRPEVGRAILQTAIVPVTGSFPKREDKPDSQPAAAEEKSKPTPPAPALPEE